MSAVNLIREIATPQNPEPTSIAPQLVALPGIKAVLFDVYGTLFISQSGGSASTDTDLLDQTMARALQEEGIVTTPTMQLGSDMKQLIHVTHARAKASGILFPEVEIREIWQSLLKRSNLILSAVALERVAIRHENHMNPVWPMPGALQTLLSLRQLGLAMGIISNAQFYTPPLFEALLEYSLEDLGIREDLCLWSFEKHEAKPSQALFASHKDLLAMEGIDASQVLFVGNDMRTDIAPAASVGFKTVLVAGDARSLRLREEDNLGARPDIIVTELEQLVRCLTPAT
jgi:putative hydrolase of the HAD superfamily